MHTEAGEADDAKIPEWGTKECKGYTVGRFGEKMRMECLGDDLESEEWILAAKVTSRLDSIPN